MIVEFSTLSERRIFSILLKEHSTVVSCLPPNSRPISWSDAPVCLLLPSVPRLEAVGAQGSNFTAQRQTQRASPEGEAKWKIEQAATEDRPPRRSHNYPHGLFEKLPGSRVWWIRYADSMGRIRRE